VIAALQRTHNYICSLRPMMTSSSEPWMLRHVKRYWQLVLIPLVASVPGGRHASFGLTQKKMLCTGLQTQSRHYLRAHAVSETIDSNLDSGEHTLWWCLDLISGITVRQHRLQRSGLLRGPSLSLQSGPPDSYLITRYVSSLIISGSQRPSNSSSVTYRL